ncbi:MULTISPECIES: GGDEF domain-containing protein [Silvimonas]|uniref:GGDEF domain-containing protein n=1 Tax=Silvimonas TaxID=300264 RepID=UPI0024B3A76A|nr:MULTISPECIES: sensor domain-containing diguanylate cyclase [Silvimonas]MDR3428627.1 diguanylate cyclase [Silvimonas sp.]
MLETLRNFIISEVGVGIFAVDKQYRVLLWNRFMADHSGVSAEAAIGQNLFELFPDLPQKWLAKKVDGVFTLHNFAFTSWEQRPWLFPFRHNRPITGGIDFMQQNCTFMPVREATGEVSAVAVTVSDVTDAAVYQSMLKQAMAKLEESSSRDGLTGVYNRRFTEARLVDEIARVERYQAETFSVILLDLDHFKQINDTHGHLGGDEVLREVVERIRRVLRDTDVFGRYGGEEFLLMLPQTGRDGAIAAAERIRRAIAESPISYDEVPIAVTGSLGVAVYEPGTPKVDRVKAQADLALYSSKRAGRNRVTFYSAQMVDKELGAD